MNFKPIMTEQEYLNLSSKYFQEKRYEKAKDIASEASLNYPQSKEAWYNLALIESYLGNLEKSVSHYKKVINIDPKFELAYLNLGVVLIKLKQINKGLETLSKLININHHSFEAYFNIGLALTEIGKFSKAHDNFNKALMINDKYAPAYFQIGSILLHGAKIEASIKAFDQALRINPYLTLSQAGLAIANLHLRNFSLAKEAFDKAIKMGINENLIIEPLFSLSRKTCDWNKVKEYEKKLNQATINALEGKGGQVEPPFTSIERLSDPKMILKIAKYWSNSFKSNIDKYQFSHKKKRRQNKKIKIGYLSCDFQEHPVAMQIVDLFKYHNKNKFDLYIYSYGRDDNSKLRRNIEKYSTHFYDLSGKDHEDIVLKIFNDKIDILVDLVGFTGFQKPDITAYKPAPIQISYLGYPGTTGSDYIDYTIVDKYVITNELRKYFSENMIYMPNCFQVCSPYKYKKINYLKKDFNLPEGKIVFCCFNRPEKIEEKLFDMWIEILKKIPNSVLWLSPRDSLTKINIVKYATKKGLRKERLIFADRVKTIDQHLNRLKLADIALDTLNYNGATTTSNCLQMGIPVITMMGKSMASRVCGSFLMNNGLSSLITRTKSDYIKLAIKLAKNTKELTKIKAKISNNNKVYSLFNSKKYTKQLESAYEKIWEDYLHDRKLDINIK